MNTNALKIEDIATILPNISDAEIALSDDKNFDYDLNLFVDNTDINKDDIINFIETTSKNEKALNGKIKYTFTNKKSESYIKNIG